MFQQPASFNILVIFIPYPSISFLLWHNLNCSLLILFQHPYMHKKHFSKRWNRCWYKMKLEWWKEVKTDDKNVWNFEFCVSYFEFWILKKLNGLDCKCSLQILWLKKKKMFLMMHVYAYVNKILWYPLSLLTIRLCYTFFFFFWNSSNIHRRKTGKSGIFYWRFGRAHSRYSKPNVWQFCQNAIM